MKITCISDLHGNFPILPGGDLLLIGGDLTARDTEQEYFECFDWIYEQDYCKKILIGGNHDMRIEEERYEGPKGVVDGVFTYLCDSGIQWKGFNIWGSPRSLKFEGMNPKCTAFTGSEQSLRKYWNKIPSDTDILITHTPPYGILDLCYHGDHAGSKNLEKVVRERIRPKLHCFGHIHEWGGRILEIGKIKYANASLVNEEYKPLNGWLDIELI